MTTSSSTALPLPAVVVVYGALYEVGSDLCQMLVDREVTTIGVNINDANAELKDRGGYIHVSGDVSEEKTWQALVKILQSKSHASYSLVTSASILAVAALLDTSNEEVGRSLRTNVTGTALSMISNAAADDRCRPHPYRGGGKH